MPGGWSLCLGMLASAFVFALLPTAASLAAEEPTELTGKAPELDEPRDTPETGVTQVPGRYIVVLEDSVDHPGAVAEAQVGGHHGRLGFVYRHALLGYSAQLSPAAVEDLRKTPNVKFISPVRKYEVAAQQTPIGVKRIGAATNPALDIDEIDDARTNVDVAVIDTGIDYTHPDLNVAGRTNCVPAGESDSEWNIEQCVDNAGIDSDGHGTHVAGTVGAIDNGSGVVGVAPGARLWAVRVLGNEGFGWDPWIIAGIDWVAAHASQIEVANMSLGGEGRSAAAAEAINGAVDAGVVMVVAAGNDAQNALKQSPANVPAAITVSAMVDTDGIPGGKGSSCQGKDDSLARTGSWGSNWGSAVDVAAPGACVYSTLPVSGVHYGATEYGSLSGTSMATPHVSGVAAVLAAISNPGNKADVEAIRNQLVAGGSLNWNDSSEDGAYEPLVYVGSTPISSPEAATGGWQSDDVGTVTVTGALNARGLEATYKFEYGSTTSYGKEVITTWTQSSTGSYKSVKAKVEDLEPGRTYHYRLALTTPQGTVFGADRTFVPSQWASKAPQGGPVPEDEQLSAVSCLDDSWCMAVDWWDIAEGTQRIGSYVFTDAGQWTFKSMPYPSGAFFPTIRGVSCTSSSNCIAVGKVQLGNEVVPLAERWDGRKWSMQSVPAPPTGAAVPYSRLDEVSCSSGTECMAVGYFKVSDSPTWQVHVARLKEGKWTNMYPLPPGSGDLLGVSCPSASFCAATGRGETVIWNGSSWSAHPPATNARLEDVSCTSPSFCLAVGPEPSGAVWDGSKWSKVERQPTELRGVDCVSPTHCIAAGYSREVGVQPVSIIHPVVERWTGSSFVAQGTVRESEKFAYFWDVDCGATGGCKAVGALEAETRNPLIAASRDWRPEVALEAPVVTSNGATLKGTVDPNGFSTGYRFEWGPTSSYGNVVPIPDQAVGSGDSPVKVSQAATELNFNSTYHYRLVAEGAEGTSATGDATFKTLDLAPAFSKSVGTSGSGQGQFHDPFGVAINPVNGSVAVADALNNRIQIFDEEGTYLRQIGSVGSENGKFKEPYAVAFDRQGDLWVADTYNNRIQELSETGQFIRAFGTEGSGDGQFKNPFGIVVDASDNVWVADTFNKRVQAFDASGTFLRKYSIGEYDYGIAVDPEGDVWTSTASKIREHSSAGTLLHTFGSSGSGNGQLWNARGIAIDPDGNVWVADSFNNRVQILSPAGVYLSKFGSEGTGPGQFAFPAGVAVDRKGNVWVSDKNNSRLQKFKTSRQWNPGGIIVNAQAATEVRTSDAILRGGIDLYGTSDPGGTATTYQFEYGKTTAYGTAVPVPAKLVGAGSGPVYVSQVLAGLAPSTTYHYRLSATNSSETARSVDMQFTTIDARPSATTEAATEVYAHEATLRASVNPNGLDTQYRFEYGLTSSYGSLLPLHSVGAGEAPISVSESLGELQAGSTYHFRISATNDEGTKYGADMQFTTLPQNVEWWVEGKTLAGLGLSEESLTGSGGQVVVDSKVLGQPFHMTCTNNATSGKILQGGGAEASFELTGCAVSTPSGCTVTTPLKLATHVDPLIRPGGSVYERFTPASGTSYATMKISGCAAAASYPLKGALVARPDRSKGPQVNQAREFSAAISEATEGSFLVGNAPATLSGSLNESLGGANKGKIWGISGDEPRPQEWLVEGTTMAARGLSQESVAGSGGPITLSGKLLGQAFEMSCTPSSSGSILKGGGGEGSLTLSGCAVAKPSSACTVPASIVLAAKSELFFQLGHVLYERFRPASGTSFASFAVSKCAVAGTYPLKGLFAAQIDSSLGEAVERPRGFSLAINEAAASGLVLGVNAASLTGSLKYHLSGANAGKRWSEKMGHEWSVGGGTFADRNLPEEAVTGSGAPLTISGKLLGQAFEMSCTPSSSGSLIRGGAAEENVVLSGCAVAKPSNTCTVPASIALSATAELVRLDGVLYERLQPAAGASFATVSVSKCGVAGSFPLKGLFSGRAKAGQGEAATQTWEFSAPINEASGSALVLGANAASVSGAINESLSGPHKGEPWSGT